MKFKYSHFIHLDPFSSISYDLIHCDPFHPFWSIAILDSLTSILNETFFNQKLGVLKKYLGYFVNTLTQSDVAQFWPTAYNCSYQASTFAVRTKIHDSRIALTPAFISKINDVIRIVITRLENNPSRLHLSSTASLAGEASSAVYTLQSVPQTNIAETSLRNCWIIAEILLRHYWE